MVEAALGNCQKEMRDYKEVAGISWEDVEAVKTKSIDPYMLARVMALREAGRQAAKGPSVSSPDEANPALSLPPCELGRFRVPPGGIVHVDYVVGIGRAKFTWHEVGGW